MRILLTGGAGFIGSHVLKIYLEAGHEVIVVDDLSGGRREGVPYHVPFYRVDICDRSAFGDLVRQVRPDVINHHAGLVGVRQSHHQSKRYMLVNAQGTANVLWAALSVGVRKFIFASSGSAVYGNSTRLPILEDELRAPISPYGQSKMISESLVMRENNRLETIILRYGNVYGSRQGLDRDKGVISIFTHNFLAKHSPRIYGDGSQTRDYIHVQDAAAANLKALIPGVSGVFNIGSGQGHRVDDVYNRIESLFDSSLAPEYLGPNPIEIQDVVLDVTRADTTLDWAAEVDFYEGLTRTVMGIAARIGVAGKSLPKE